MGGATRFLMLLTTPFPFLHPRPSLLRLARHARHARLSSSSLASFSTSSHYLTLPPSSRHRLGCPIKASEHIHTQTSTIRDDHFGDGIGFSQSPQDLHPWPEWLKLVERLTAGGYFDRQRFASAEGFGIGAEDDKFVAVEGLPDEFLRAASACLAFSRDRPNLLGSLPRRDIQVVVENGSAFLFKSAHDSARRMRLFLGSGESNVLESDKAQMVDLMKFLLSYASNPMVSLERNNLYNEELVESSVRLLLNELANMNYSAPVSELSGSVQNQFPDEYGQRARTFGQNIEMKRGDWICPRCSFMNFARNVKCLECEEARPKRQLTGGEWECPQCDFFNYGRNLVCLRCDCKRPGELSLSSTNSKSGFGNSNGSYANKVDVDSRLAANEEKAERWFSKISQLENTSDSNSVIADEDFPEIMPLRKGVNRFVVSTRKTPLERRLANAQYRRNLGNDGTPEDKDFQTGGVNKPLDMTAGRSLDEILGRSSAVSETDNKSNNAGQSAGSETTSSITSSSSTQYGRPKEGNSINVPFVPLPVDMFAKKLHSSKTEEDEKQVTDYESGASKAGERARPVFGDNEFGKSGGSVQKPASQTESEDKEKEQAEKSERWFKRVAELHDVTDLASAISDEDFPDIMPMRKGENRFVVSKKKDRSLTSPVYKRRMAMDQAGNTNFVPFVPFPPDYFAKKDKQQPDGANSSEKATGETPTSSVTPEKLPEKLDYGVPDRDYVQGMENQQTSTGSWSSRSSGENLAERKTDVVYGAPTNGNLTQNSDNPLPNRDRSSVYTGKENTMETTNMKGSSPLPSENRNTREGWTGKSLEGSAVKEPDPLDMSEEAKAERWFRRVAQIKDISELSQIPDSDFPSIMPMRKGVNRFVVSKRKTPLERRLTSPQYRRNLPIVSSDPGKKENDSS
ncbi:hypothetical protein L1049_012935 [Liquidambar formosana]|uniref:RanBP2-type domain-containing protein n=1 Tax=Liquidambar formosana TaxID=63359 RepID=A0AAP0RLI9_LIQFO